MPITSSAKKALRKSDRRRKQNLERTAALKRMVKAFKKNPTVENLSAVYKRLDKNAKTNTIKKNKASRLKAQFSKLVK